MDLSTRIFDNTLLAWIGALGTTLLLAVAILVGQPLLLRFARRLAARTATRWDDAVVEALGRTRPALAGVVILYVGSRWLQLPAEVDTLLRGAAIIAAFLQIGLWLNAVLRSALGRSQRPLDAIDEAEAAVATSVVAFGFVGQLLIWSTIVLLALANLGVDITALVAGLGVGGIAVALAVQSILGDLFASLSIVLDKPFEVGDFIVVDDCMGTVERVGVKTTRLRSLSGEQLVFANGDLLKARLRNYKRMRERRVLFRFGVLYQTTYKQLERIPGIVQRVIGQQSLARLDRAHFASFGESSLDFEVVYWMLDPDYNKYMDTQQAINLELVRLFADVGIEFAYPTRTVLLERTAPARPRAVGSSAG